MAPLDLATRLDGKADTTCNDTVGHNQDRRDGNALRDQHRGNQIPDLSARRRGVRRGLPLGPRDQRGHEHHSCAAHACLQSDQVSYRRLRVYRRQVGVALHQRPRLISCRQTLSRAKRSYRWATSPHPAFGRAVALVCRHGRCGMGTTLTCFRTAMMRSAHLV